MADPYGRDKPSPLPVPGPRGSEYVPPASLPPQYPWYLKPIPINTRNTLRVLRGYLDRTEPKIGRWLYSTWNAEAEAIKYQEIRNAIRDGEVPVAWIEQWQQDYSRFVVETLEPGWKDAMRNAGEYMARHVDGYAFKPTGERINQWIEVRGGELAVNLTVQQHNAIRALIRYHTVDEPVSPAELARRLRPVIGLTPNEELAVRNYRAQLLKQGLDRARVANQVSNYAGFLHRRRATRIARTELSFSYNFGQLEAVRQASEQGFFSGPVVKTWMTADDERVCYFCGPMDGQTLDLEDTFPGATDRLPCAYTPPAHPGCRCTVGYSVVKG